jgi:hypothetical protein
MDIIDKYTNTKDKDKLENKDKVVLSDDTFAIVEALNAIVRAIK